MLHSRCLHALFFVIWFSAAAAAQEAPQPLQLETLLQNGRLALQPSDNVVREVFAQPPTLDLTEALNRLDQNVSAAQKLEAARSVIWKSINSEQTKRAIDFLETQTTPEAGELLWSATELGKSKNSDATFAIEALKQAADAGSTPAKADLLNRYVTGTDTLRNFKASADIVEGFDMDAPATPLTVRRDYAQALEKGWLGTTDLAKSEDVWKGVLASDGALPADFTRFAIVRYQRDNRTPSPEVFSSLITASDRGDSLATVLGFDLARSQNDMNGVRTWSERLVAESNRNVPEATVKLGTAYLDGSLGAKNEVQALDLFLKANRQGSDRAAGLAAKLILDADENGARPDLAKKLNVQQIQDMTLNAARDGDALALSQYARIQVRDGKIITGYRNLVASHESSRPSDKVAIAQALYKVCGEYLVDSCEPVPLFYFTNRKPSNDANIGFLGEADPAGQIHFGIAKVEIPTAKKIRAREKWYPALAWEVLQNSTLGQATPLPAAPALDKTDVTTAISTDTLDGYIDDLRKVVSASHSQKVLVFIHGYNNSFVDGARRAALLAEQFKYPGVPVYLSWPSAGNTVLANSSDSIFPQSAYEADGTAVSNSCKDFVPVLRKIVQTFKPENVMVVAHSMGNRLLNYMLSTCPTEAPNTDHEIALGKAIFASPDVDVGELQAGVARYAGNVGSLTLYAMANDFALRTAENIMQMPQRAGIGGPRLAVIDKVNTVDATTVENQSPDNDPLNHSSFFDVPQVKQDLYELLRWTDDITARRCTIEELDAKTGRTYWLISPACLS